MYTSISAPDLLPGMHCGGLERILQLKNFHLPFDKIPLERLPEIS